jgi:hypothetical protein
MEQFVIQGVVIERLLCLEGLLIITENLVENWLEHAPQLISV